MPHSELFDTDEGYEVITWASQADCDADADNGRAIERRPACLPCVVGNILADAGDIATGANVAYWHDETGHSDGVPARVCDACLAAGSSSGPGYRATYDPRRLCEICDKPVDCGAAHCEQCGADVRAVAIEAMLQATDAADLWEAATVACELHQVQLGGSLVYADTAITARSRGHAELAEALAEAEAMQTKFERDAVSALAEADGPQLEGAIARRCYGCDRPLDRHAPDRVVYCGRCGEVER